MADAVVAMEPLVAHDRLLQPVSGNQPAGEPLRSTPAYDQLRQALRPPDTAPGGVWQRDQKPTDYRALVKTAGDLLATRSKDLDIAVWMTEALTREHGIAGLAEGIQTIRELLDAFWDTIYPLIDEDGDEGFRARPLNRLNTAFIPALAQLPITFDGRTLYEYNSSLEVPDAAKADNSSDLRAKRERAIAEGSISPEQMKQSIEETSAQFYEVIEGDIRRASEEAGLLQRVCDARFKTSDRPLFEGLSEQLEKLRGSILSVQRVKGMNKVVAAPAPPPLPARQIDSPSPASSPAPEIQVAEPAPEIHPPTRQLSVLDHAAELRRADPSDPVPYMLVRSWRFGPMIARGAIREDDLKPPSTELRTTIRRAVLNGDWTAALDACERAMEDDCGASWLDVQQCSARACRELGYGNAANAIRGMTAAYLQILPDLLHAVMVDGSPAANPETLAWIQTEVLFDKQRERTESLDEVRPVEPLPDPDAEPDAFEVAENELNAGRFNEAVRVLAEAIAREQSGRARIQRKIQLAKICMEAGQNRVALPLLREVLKTIEEHHLEQWESAQFTATPMAMLHSCLVTSGEDAEERRRIYNNLCTLDPLKALDLSEPS